MSPLPSPSRSRPLRTARWPTVLGLVTVLGLATGCDAASDLLGPPAPSLEELPRVLEPHAAALDRVSCGGCPERWEPRSCTFTDELLRTRDLGATRCAVVQTPRNARALPERVLPSARARVGATTRALAEADDPVEEALLLYSFGADLQRLGRLPLWKAGLEARTQALVLLAGRDAEDESRRWPAELLALEATAPAPGRAADVAVLDTAARMQDPGWGARQSLLVASQAARTALRVPTSERADAMRKVRAGLFDALPDAPAGLDLLDAWQAAEVVRERSIGIALDGALRSRRHCPESLEALVPATLQSVPDGWQLDPRTCRAQHLAEPVPPPAPTPTSTPDRGAPAPSGAGAMAAPRSTTPR